MALIVCSRGRSNTEIGRDLFVAEGYNNVSIRKIAERIEYSPAAIYSYFPSKDDIFLALAEEGFRILFACDERPPAAARLRAIQRPDHPLRQRGQGSESSGEAAPS